MNELSDLKKEYAKLQERYYVLLNALQNVCRDVLATEFVFEEVKLEPRPKMKSVLKKKG